MALRYTGRADILSVNGKLYAKRKIYDKNPSAYDGSLDKPLNISKEDALNLTVNSNSNLHSFADAKGEDILDSATKPASVSAKEK